MNSSFLKTIRVVAVLTCLTWIGSASAQHTNINQAEIDALNDATALLTARSANDKAQAAAIAARAPGFGDDFGKDGKLTIESAERDKFHVTARAAEAFSGAAQQLAAVIANSEGRSVLLTDLDRSAIPVYWRENTRLMRIGAAMRTMLGTPITPESVPAAGLLSVGSLLSELAQATQLFRSDKSIAFTTTELSDEVLLDQLVVATRGKLLYPAGVLDALLDGSYPTEFAKELHKVTLRRNELLRVKAPDVDKAKALLTEIDAMASDLSGIDPGTKSPLLLSALRGELVSTALAEAKGQVFSLKVAAKGGASLKVTSIWHSDHLYAAGGVVASYRLTSGGVAPTVLKAGVVTQETGYQRIPLN